MTTQPQSWWSWVTGGDPEGISVDPSKEIIITNPGGRRTWVDNLSNDDRDRLHKAIDYKIHSSQHTEDVSIALAGRGRESRGRFFKPHFELCVH